MTDSITTQINIIAGNCDGKADSKDFDTREFDGSHMTLQEIEAEIGDALEAVSARHQSDANVALCNSISDLSIGDLFQMIKKASVNNKIGTVNVYVASAGIRDYLINRIPPMVPLIQPYRYKKREILIATGDITEVIVDAIVNASNVNLKLGAGVSGAIREKAGSGLQKEMDMLVARRHLVPGDALATRSHNLATCSYIIHAATAEGSRGTVTKAVSNCLSLCQQMNIRSVAFPALGAGTGNLDMEACAQTMLGTIINETDKMKELIPQKIFIILWTKYAFSIFKKVYHAITARDE